jgi:hypothetical protein
MKKLLIIIIILYNNKINAQNYIMFSPSITNIEGNIKNKANVYFEIGRQ